MKGTQILILLLPLVAIFLLMRSQRRRQMQALSFRDSLEVGEQVITAGGIYGRIASLEGDVVQLEVADGVTVRLMRAAVAQRVAQPGAERGTDRPPDDAPGSPASP